MTERHDFVKLPSGECRHLPHECCRCLRTADDPIHTAAAPTEQPAANLGLATTRELLDEIRARIEVDHSSGMPGGLDYRTVGGRGEDQS